MASNVDVLVPYTRPEQANLVLAVLASEGIVPELLPMGHETSYWDLLAFRWALGASFAIVEQDVLPAWGALREMEACDALWCTCETLIGGALYPAALGCAKFSAALLRSEPRVVEDLLEHGWHSLDWSIARALVPLTPHVHQPPAHHLNVGHWAQDDRWAYERVAGCLTHGAGASFPDRWEGLPHLGDAIDIDTEHDESKERMVR